MLMDGILVIGISDDGTLEGFENDETKIKYKRT